MATQRHPNFLSPLTFDALKDPRNREGFAAPTVTRGSVEVTKVSDWRSTELVRTIQAWSWTDIGAAHRAYSGRGKA